jgi:hypothetical protein
MSSVARLWTKSDGRDGDGKSAGIREWEVVQAIYELLGGSRVGT